MISYYRKHKNKILNLSLKKIYSYFFLNNIKKDSYYYYLKNLLYQFFVFKNPNLNNQNFINDLDSLVVHHDNYQDLSVILEQLFNSEFKIDDDIESHYKSNEKKILLKFIIYSINTKLIKRKYVDIYDFAINQIKDPLKILEIGGGMPHGFIYSYWKRKKFFFDHIHYIDANLLHSDFVKWYFQNNNISNSIELYPAAKTPKIDNIEFNFIFAKDIFEHLDDPDTLIEDIISNTTNSKTLLCLDLEHKGAKTVQHINPNLPILKKKLENNNFQVIKKFDEVHIWKKMQ